MDLWSVCCLYCVGIMYGVTEVYRVYVQYVWSDKSVQGVCTVCIE